MAKDPSVLFYTSDFLSGTAHMTRNEKGLFIELLCHQQQRGALSMDFIKRISGSDFMAWDFIKDKFTQDDQGNFFNKRMTEEVQRRKKFSESRSKNRGKKEEVINISSTYVKDMNNISNSYEQHMENENENENEIEDKKEKEYEIQEIKEEIHEEVNLWPSFDDFWDMYDKKFDRSYCERKWFKLRQKEREDVMNFLPDYIESTPDKTFRKHPKTFFNSEAWKNEIIKYGKQQTTKNAKPDSSRIDQAIDAFVGARKQG